MPCDGLPMLEDWLTHAASIWAIGYEPWREAVEIKPTSQTVLGQHMGFADVEPTKGVGRISMLLFTVWYSYLKLKDVLLSPLKGKSLLSTLAKEF
jgi:glycyl-tRNA synthetase alpha subunit